MLVSPSEILQAAEKKSHHFLNSITLSATPQGLEE